MDISKSYKIFGITLVVASTILYFFHYLIFHDPHHIFIFLVSDIAFVPIEVLLVTMILHKLLSDMERSKRLEKLNMVIGVFFSEVGTKLLTFFSDADPGLENVRNRLIVRKDWTDEDFEEITTFLRNYEYSVNIGNVDLVYLRDFLRKHRSFMAGLLENPSLLEHESFTGLLRAVFHLMEELVNREDLQNLPESDFDHLGLDIERAYSRLVIEWLDYMKYLKDNHPYLFSLAMRTNPFDTKSSAVVHS
ncbi:hypothetical protein [Methanohalophilus mahii]|uniref:Uncharacterized protein n=1 Tax=Methanohalophilus mahii (strain ATCC 35705 / DSM 5219 / SLP) TaxID=547558 RepID=D5EB76_METMS|nr:hypothetical protein [Methanohalophilus mahii]ADE36427.1 conserved hypothetical protein [Methanohalophilus mahii DSM 5219]